MWLYELVERNASLVGRKKNPIKLQAILKKSFIVYTFVQIFEEPYFI